VVAIEITDCGANQCIEVITTIGKRYYADGLEVVEQFGQKWLLVVEKPRPKPKDLPLI